MNDLFIKASRMNLQYNSSIGILNVSDLWNIRLEVLDQLARGLSKGLRECEEDSFITPATAKTELLKIQLEIAKYIIQTRLEDLEKAKLLVANRERKQKILSILASKEDESLQQKSKEELLRELEELE